MGFNKWASATARHALRLHTPLSKLFGCRAQFVPLSLSSAEWHYLHYFEKQQGESISALNMPQTPSVWEYSVPAIMY